MIKESMEKALNGQIHEELASAYIYLAMAADFEAKNMNGFAGWMKMQAKEEVGHAMKIYAFINDRGGRARFATIEAPQSEWTSPLEAFKAAYGHEKYITGTIEKLVMKSRDEKDLATEAFLAWFINEQVEEESNTDTIVRKLEMIGGTANGLYMLDRELGARAAG